MIILGIETSCDETAIALIDAAGERDSGVRIRVLADKTLSQIELHRPYGGVFPALAKREHSRMLVPMLTECLAESGLLKKPPPNRRQHHPYILKYVRMMLEREPELAEQFEQFITSAEKPPLDAIAVTEGPGLEPCLWTGINFARALKKTWGTPVIPINHMEGHIFAALLSANSAARPGTNAERRRKNTLYTLTAPAFPAIALLISGGHTELVHIKDWSDYELAGETRDDAVGEAFDKVARLLGLPYPGGPEISALAEQARESEVKSSKLKVEEKKNPAPRGGVFWTTPIKLPRPMLNSDNLDLSFSGLKTAVLYLLKKIGTPDEKTKTAIAREFEDAVTEVLVAKTRKAIERFGAQTLLIGGGVAANTNIRRAFEALAEKTGIELRAPEPNLTTDNALMIAVAGYLKSGLPPQEYEPTARGNLRLDKEYGAE